jgi:mono/diheme cytochrome c family protein
VNQIDIGGSLVVAGGFGQNPGTFTAVDVTTGKIVWQHRWQESCYAGSTTTAGNVVFIGRSDGRLMAFNATTGKGLWQFQTGGGANDAPTIFEMNGTEYVAFYAGGNALAGSPHSDNFWLFSLDGTLNPVAAPGAGQGIEHAGATKSSPKQTTPKSNTTGSAGSAAAGKPIFASNCSTCHGALGTGGNGGPNLTQIPSAKNLQTVIGQVTNGGGGMPAFRGQLSNTQIQQVATYVSTVAGR